MEAVTRPVYDVPDPPEGRDSHCYCECTDQACEELHEDCAACVADQKSVRRGERAREEG